MEMRGKFVCSDPFPVKANTQGCSVQGRVNVRELGREFDFVKALLADLFLYFGNVFYLVLLPVFSTL